MLRVYIVAVSELVAGHCSDALYINYLTSTRVILNTYLSNIPVTISHYLLFSLYIFYLLNVQGE